MKLGAIIKGYRDQNDLTIEEFSSASGISKSYISIIESGRSDGSTSYASHGFLVRSDYIFTLSKEEGSGARVRIIGFRPHLLVVEPSALLLSDFARLGC